jgi:hypothetical protein
LVVDFDAKDLAVFPTEVAGDGAKFVRDFRVELPAEKLKAV